MRPKRPTAILFALLLAAAVLLGFSAAGSGRTLDPNPADDPALLAMKMDPNRYDGAGGCVSKDPRGMKALIRFMKRTTKKNVPYGTIRCDGGVHGTGRALDWGLDARKRSEKRMAMTVINTWLADDRRGRNNALARRMGVQLIIYNCRWWQAGDRGWSPYSACSGKHPDPTQGHIDHVHIELTKPSSKLRTSYWRSGVSAEGGGTPGSGGGGISPG